MISTPSSQEISQNYGDFDSLQKLKSKAIKDQDGALKEVAKQFEQIFLNMMLESMRSAGDSFADEDSPFSSSDVKFYQGMYDQQMSMALTKENGIGLSDIIVRQLSGNKIDSKSISNALKMPDSEEDIGKQIQSGRTVNELVLNLAARKVAKQSYNRVDSIVNASPILGAINAKRDDGILQDKAFNDSVVVDSTSSTGSISHLPKTFNTPEEFVEFLLPKAKKYAEKLGVDPKVLVAQAALETGWGKSISSEGDKSSFNLFNIKANNWSGDKVTITTTEYREGLKMKEKASFRAYEGYEESFEDYVKLIESAPRYKEAVKVASDPIRYLEELQKAGYATDPKYAEKINNIMQASI